MSDYLPAMLPPMHVLAENQQQKAHVNRIAKRPVRGSDRGLLCAANAYGDKLRLLAFQSDRLMHSYAELQREWRVPFDPRRMNPSATPRQRLAMDLCFEYVVLKIGYDALGKVIKRLMPDRLHGQVSDSSFTDVATWLRKNGKQRGVPEPIVEAVVSRHVAYESLDDFRNRFVHRSSRAMVSKMRNGQLAFNLDRHTPVPIKTTVRKHIRTHFELAFQVEAHAMSEQSPAPHVPGCMFLLSHSVADLWRPESIRHFGIEQFIIEHDESGVSPS